jgi:hypothetical protein
MGIAIARMWAIVLVLLFAGTVGWAAPLTPGNILLSDLDSGRVIEYTPAGKEVQRVRSGTTGIRDIVVDSNGDVHVFNAPTLLTVTPSDGRTVTRKFLGWSVNYPSVTSRGGIGQTGNFVFVTDTDTGPSGSPGEASGLVRFDLVGGKHVRVADGQDYQDLTIGGDGLLYGLHDTGWYVDVFDPHSLQELRSIPLEFELRKFGIRSIAVDAKGTIYAAPWNRSDVYAVNQDGFRIDTLDTPGIAQYSDIDLDSSGRLLLGNWYGDVVLTDVSLKNFTSFKTNKNQYTLTKMIHVAFTSPLEVVPEPAGFAIVASVGLLIAGRVARPRRRIDGVLATVPSWL